MLPSSTAILCVCVCVFFSCRNRSNSRAQKFAEKSPTLKQRGTMVKFMFVGDSECGKTSIVSR